MIPARASTRHPHPVASGWFLLALCAVLLSGCTVPFHRQPLRPGRTTLNAQPVQVPAENIGNFLVLQAKWDRYGPYHFIIDTGSAATVVTPNLVKRYGTASGGNVRVSSAEGDILELPSATLSRLELGEARFEDVPVLVYDLAALSAHLGIRIDGLLGFPLFRETRLTLDYPNSRVLLEPVDATALPPGIVVPFDDHKRIPLIKLRLGDRNLFALIDSGSDATLSLNPVGLDAAFVSPPRPGATIGTLGGDHPQQIGRLAEDVGLGSYLLQRPVVDLTNELTAIGGGILKHFTVTFDAANGRVSFHRIEPGPISIPPRRSAGLSFSKMPAYWRVAGVIKGSPADAAGIQFGDLVTRIDGELVSKWDLRRYEQRVAEAREITFHLLFGTEEVEKRVAVFDLVK